MVPFNEYGIVREEKLLVVRVQSPGCDQYRGHVRAHAGDLPGDGVFKIERYDGPDVVVRPQVEYERGVRDQEHDFRGPGGTLSPCDPAHLLHKERLILRMQIELRFIDDQVVVPVIVQVREENEELLDTVALVTIQPIRLPAVPSHRLRHEVAGVPFQHHIAPEEMAQRRFYLDAEVQSVFEQQNGIHARSFFARATQMVEGVLRVSGSEVVAEIRPDLPRIRHLAQPVRTKQPSPERASPELTQ